MGGILAASLLWCGLLSPCASAQIWKSVIRQAKPPATTPQPNTQDGSAQSGTPQTSPSPAGGSQVYRFCIGRLQADPSASNYVTDFFLTGTQPYAEVPALRTFLLRKFPPGTSQAGSILCDQAATLAEARQKYANTIATRKNLVLTHWKPEGMQAVTIDSDPAQAELYSGCVIQIGHPDGTQVAYGSDVFPVSGSQKGDALYVHYQAFIKKQYGLPKQGDRVFAPSFCLDPRLRNAAEYEISNYTPVKTGWKPDVSETLASPETAQPSSPPQEPALPRPAAPLSNEKAILRCDPENLDAHRNLMRVYCDGGRGTSASCLKEVLWFVHRHPENDEILRNSMGLLTSAADAKQLREAWQEQAQSTDTAVQLNLKRFAMMSDPAMMQAIMAMPENVQASKAPAWAPTPLPPSPFNLPEVPADVAASHLISGASSGSADGSASRFWVAISKDGHVELSCPVSGHVAAGQQHAAAVLRELTYRPFLIDSKPAAVITEVQVK